jgi:pimeloyl-ACP methyl ester carboxylesterase
MPSTYRLSMAAVCAITAAAAALLVAPTAAEAAQPSHTQYCPAVDLYRIHDCSSPPRLPGSPAGRQLAWALDQLSGRATTLTEAEVRRHYAPDYLTQVMPASAIIEQFRWTIAELGPLSYQGLAFPPRSRQAIAVANRRNGERVAIAVSVDATGQTEDLRVQPAPPTIVPRGRYSGLFDVGGRRMFLRCTGHGHPTVVFELGLTTDWKAIQDALSPFMRVCSYDPPNADGPFSRSDPAPTPRTSQDVVADLHTLLHRAGVPGPYVLAGFSNGGLNSLLYASTHPTDVAGLVLIDGVHPDYYARRFAVLKPLLAPDVFNALYESSRTLPPRLLDPEQFDIVTSQAQVRASLASHALHRMPLSVLTHGIPAPPPPNIENWPVSADENLWRDLQDELAALEPGSHHVIAAHSDHDIPLNQPDLVLREVTRVARAAH